MSDALERLTVCIPTRDRYELLARVLRYIERTAEGLNVLVLDSSSVQTPASLSAALSAAGAGYERFDADIPFMEKVRAGVRAAETPYVVLWADDDYLVPAALGEAARTLDADDGLAGVTGVGLLASFRPGRMSTGDYPQPPIHGATAADRLVAHYHRYSTTFYSVQRTSNLSHALDHVREAGIDLSWGEYWAEYALSALLVIGGRVTRMERLYIVREAHAGQASQGVADFFDFMHARTYGEDYARVRDLLAEHVAAKDAISRADAEAAVKHAWWAFTGRALPHKYRQAHEPAPKRATLLARAPGFVAMARRARKVQAWLPLGIRGQNVDALSNPRNPYHADFMPVMESLTEWIQASERS